jgi:endonuclease/exonuclease/phosphatase (EEP) superfamily protein YafD
LIGLGLLAVLFLVGNRPRLAIVFILFSGINFGVVLPLYVGKQEPTSAVPSSLRAMLINVNTRLGDAERVIQVIHAFNPDLVVLEEINSQWLHDLKSLTPTYPYTRIQPREDNFGIGLFSKLPLPTADIVYIGDAMVPSILATVKTEQTSFCVIATHPPPPDGAEYSRWRNGQLEQIANYISSSTPVLLLGDLNLTPWNYYFKQLLKQANLKDSSQGRGVQPTWPTDNPLLLIPIDHCLHSSDIHMVRKIIGPKVGSDHYPVIVDFTIKKEDKQDRTQGND